MQAISVYITTVADVRQVFHEVKDINISDVLLGVVYNYVLTASGL